MGDDERLRSLPGGPARLFAPASAPAPNWGRPGPFSWPEFALAVMSQEVVHAVQGRVARHTMVRGIAIVFMVIALAMAWIVAGETGVIPA